MLVKLAKTHVSSQSARGQPSIVRKPEAYPIFWYKNVTHEVLKLSWQDK